MFQNHVIEITGMGPKEQGSPSITDGFISWMLDSNQKYQNLTLPEITTTTKSKYQYTQIKPELYIQILISYIQVFLICCFSILFNLTNYDHNTGGDDNDDGNDGDDDDIYGDFHTWNLL